MIEPRPCVQSPSTSSPSSEVSSLQEIARDLTASNRRKRELFESYLPGIEKRLSSVGIELTCRCLECVLVELKNYKRIVGGHSQVNSKNCYCNSNYNNGHSSAIYDQCQQNICS